MKLRNFFALTLALFFMEFQTSGQSRTNVPYISAIGLLDLQTAASNAPTPEANITHLCYDGQSNLFVGGYFRGCANYGALKLINTNETVVAFAGRVNDAAIPIWATNSSACLTPALVTSNPKGGMAFLSYFKGPITNTFAGSTVVSTSDWGGLILEVGPNGDVMHQFLLEANGTYTLPHVTTDPNQTGPPFAFIAAHFDQNGNLYVAGNYINAVRVDGIQLSSPYGTKDQDYFVAKFGTNGSVQWAREGGSQANDEIFDMNVDNNGNTFIVGGFGGTNVLGTNSLAAPIFDGDGFAWKLDPNGAVLWGRQASAVVGGYSRDFHGVQPDGAGGCYLAGAMSVEVDTNGSAPTTFNAFLARLTGSGDVAWSTQLIATNGTIDAELVGIDTNGNVRLAGDFDHSVSFGGQFSLSATNVGDNVFVTGLSSDGTFLWAQQFGAQLILDCKVDGLGNSFVVGAFDKSNIGGAPLQARTGSDTFVAKFDPSGIFKWAGQIGGGSPANWARNVTPDNAGGCYLAGAFSGIKYIGDTSLAGAGVEQLFIAHVVDPSATNAPSIAVQPLAHRVVGPSNIFLQVTALGSPPIMYQWMKNTTNLPSATNSVLNLNLMKRPDGGTFSVIVSNSTGFLSSSDTTVRVVVPESLQASAPSGAGLQMSFSDSDGSPMSLDDLTNFIVQYNTDLISGNWIAATNKLSLTNGMIIFEDPNVSSNRFYRVIEP